MRNSVSVFSFVLVILLLFGLINFWVGLRGWQLLGRFIPFLNFKIYWIAFGLIAISFLAGRLGGGILPAVVCRGLTVFGSYWLAVLFYLIMTLALVEIVLLVAKVTNLLPLGLAGKDRASLALGVLVFIVVGCTVAYGWWNARNPRVVHYDVSIPKQAGTIKELHVVMVSDLHLGIIVHNGRLTRLADMIGQLQPDLILMPGDIIDENPGPFVEQDMVSTFRRLSPKYGIYAVPGNHDYIGRDWEGIALHLRAAGINVLQDSWVRVADSFYLVGRDDLSRGRFTGGGRKDLEEIMKGVDRTLPVIMLDHQPIELGRSLEQGVDLMLSGHTHRGQMFPNNLITSRIYEVDWGYLRRESLQVIVSCGFGTWGPPIRVGNRPEIVDLTISFGQGEGPGR
ncbi:MAG: metallophosphoesterase [Desulfocucumaceae bacterium]